MSTQVQHEHVRDEVATTSSTQTVEHAVADELIAHWTDTLFGLRDIQFDPPFSALYDCRDRIRVSDRRAEQGAAYMALDFAFPTALGAKVASLYSAGIASTDDGGFMFAENELATSVKHRIGVVMLPFKYSRSSNFQRMQIHALDGRVIEAGAVDTVFNAFVRAFRAQTYRVDTPVAQSALIATAFEDELPTDIEENIPMLPDPWPFVVPVWPMRSRSSRDERKNP